MSENVRLEVQKDQTLLEKTIHQSLEKWIANALRKLKNAWSAENTLTGIQFYGDMDD